MFYFCANLFLLRTLRSNYRFLLVAVLVLSFYYSFGTVKDSTQKFYLAMKGQTVRGKKPVAKTLFKIYLDSSTIYQRVEADEGGWVAFQVPLQNFFTIKISKIGYVTKIITIDTHMPKSNETGDYYFEFGMDIFEDVPGLDVSMLKEPVAKIFFNTFTKNFDYDYNYTAKINKDVKELYKNYEQLKKNSKGKPDNSKSAEKNPSSDSLKTVGQNSKVIPGVTFSVELISSKDQLVKNAPDFKGIVNVKEYKDADLYHYYVGEYSSLGDAEKMKNNMSPHFPKANVIGFKEGKKLSAEEIFNLVEK